MLRNSTVAEMLLNEIGHDLVKPVDLGLIALLEAKGDVIPMYVMLPPPITQLWRTRKRRVRPIYRSTATQYGTPVIVSVPGHPTNVPSPSNSCAQLLQ